MSRLLSIHEAAEGEINEAADFYDIESPGLGSVFIDDIQRAIGRISEFPEAAPLVRGRVRKRPMPNSRSHWFTQSGRTKSGYWLWHTRKGAPSTGVVAADHARANQGLVRTGASPGGRTAPPLGP